MAYRVCEMTISRILFKAAFATSMLHAQTSVPGSGQQGKLAFILPNILDLAIQNSQSPLIANALQSSITPRWISLNSSVGAQLSNLPLQSAASSVALSFDPDSNTQQEVPQSLGPVLSERAETIGKGKIYFNVTNQTFSFDKLDRLDLRGFSVTYPLDISLGPGAPVAHEILLADAYINVTVNQTTMLMTYGATKRMDISFALPMVTSSVTVRGGASLQGALTTQLPQQSIQLSSTGVGDGLTRVKYNLVSFTKRRKTGSMPGERFRLRVALAMDVRLPIGDEFNYHGAGAYGLKPFLIASLRSRYLSPHLNAGFQYNGKSYLASQYPTEKRHLPSQVLCVAGFDSSLSPKLTMGFDLMDQIVVKGQRTLLGPSVGGAISQAPSIYFADMTRQEYSASAGFKAKLNAKTVLTANVLARLNEAGLRARVVPLVGLSYLF